MTPLPEHRVLIVSLFLPNTVQLCSQDSPILEAMQRADPPPLSGTPPIMRLPPSSLAKPGKLRSILEDLAEKASGTPLHTPTEQPNPFALPFALPPNRHPARPTPTRIPTGLANQFLPSSIQPAARTSLHGPTPQPLSPTSPTSPTSIDQLIPTPGLGRRTSRTGSRVRRSSSSYPDYRRVVTPWDVHPSPHGNVGLHKAIASVGDTLKKKVWVGILDTPTDDLGPDDRSSIEKKLGEVDNIPVWIKDDEFIGCYDVFCHQVLWPSLHYAIPDAPKTKVFYESSSFLQYKAVNERIADAIVAAYQQGDIVWVNDYHLCLVPQLVRQKIPGATIGFFLHVAFPSTEIFRCLAVREQLLYGMLGADLIGFQTHNYARHFRQTCSRILSLEALPKGIQLEHSFVDVAVFPIGIDVQDLAQKRREPDVADAIASLKQRYAGMKLIVGRDKLDGVQGVRHKMLGFETFLQKHPEYAGKVVLIQVALATTEQNELQAPISDVVSRVNSKYGTLTYLPIVVLHTSDVTFSQYLALLTVADAFIVTSLREGMALRTHEFVECQDERHRPLILSEFTGSYSYSGFRSCIAINPWDAKNTADAIYQSLTMDKEEALSRWQDLHSHVNTQTGQAFVTSFLTRCIGVHLEHQQRDPKAIPVLNVDAVLPKYKAADKRLIILDLESTLWTEDPKVTREHGFVLPKYALDLLIKLSSDPANVIWVLSGLPVEGALEKIAAAAPDVGLCAENGCFVKLPSSDEWINMVSNTNLAWKSLCVEILGYFTERTPGSFVEARGASVVWRFITGHEDDEQKRQWAFRQAAEAQNHIWDSLGERFGLRLIPGATSFLVLPKSASRSTAVAAIFKEGGPAAAANTPELVPSAKMPVAQRGLYPFTLAISGDEHLLRRLNDLHNSETCSTSRKNSDAHWRLEGKDVLDVLHKFI